MADQDTPPKEPPPQFLPKSVLEEIRHHIKKTPRMGRNESSSRYVDFTKLQKKD